jgi:hypothetical protein
LNKGSFVKSEPNYKKRGVKMKWLKVCYRNELYNRITKSKAQRLIENGQTVYIWIYDNMGYVDERIKLSIDENNITANIKYLNYLMFEYRGRVKFYMKAEVNR